MKLNQKLNFIIPVDSNLGTLYVHATPISREVFERYFLEIAQTFARIYSSGLSVYAGPKVAGMMLKRVSEELGTWGSPAGVENGLLNEIRRLANVLVPSTNGWETISFHEATVKKIVDADDASNVENALTFFTVASSMHRKEDIQSILEGAGKLWGARAESLSCTELRNSLPTLIEAASTGGKVTPSVIPS